MYYFDQGDRYKPDMKSFKTEVPGKTKQIYLTIGSVIGWFAVSAQLYLQITYRLTSVPEAVFRFFSYYTILTNILVALCFSVLLLIPESDFGKFFSRPKVLTAVGAYIVFVGIAYHLLLRHLSTSEGLQVFVNELLHSFIPLFFILYWMKFVSKTELEWKDVLHWVIYPVVYLLYILIGGVFSGFYPYPFMSVNNIGYRRVILNDGGLITAFLVLSLLFVAIGKLNRNTARLN
jgi:hypothetical protein